MLAEIAFLAELSAFFIALVFVKFMGESYAFYVVVFIGMFLVYYLKSYKQIVFATAFMFEFTAIFSLIKRDFLALMVDRLLDVAAGFFDSFCHISTN